MDLMSCQLGRTNDNGGSILQFYELTHPPYTSDQQFSRMNPVQRKVEYRLPSMKCERCGTWAGSKRIRLDERLVTEISTYLQSIGNPRFVSPQEWEKIGQDLSNRTGLPKETLGPGADYGAPTGRIRRANIADFLHPFPGTVWITSKVVDAFKDADLTGIELVPVKLKLSKKVPVENPPRLWEVVVKGHAWRHGMSLDTITVCEICRRKKFPQPEQLSVDGARWDGSDFFHVDLNPNIVFVTERVRSVLEREKYSNVRCIAV